MARYKKVEYWRAKKGLFFPKFQSKPTYKMFDGKRFKLDSWSSTKHDTVTRKQMLKQSGKLVRIIKGKKIYSVWSR